MIAFLVNQSQDHCNRRTNDKYSGNCNRERTSIVVPMRQLILDILNGKAAGSKFGLVYLARRGETYKAEDEQISSSLGASWLYASGCVADEGSDAYFRSVTFTEQNVPADDGSRARWMIGYNLSGSRGGLVVELEEGVSSLQEADGIVYAHFWMAEPAGCLQEIARSSQEVGEWRKSLPCFNRQQTRTRELASHGSVRVNKNLLNPLNLSIGGAHSLCPGSVFVIERNLGLS